MKRITWLVLQITSASGGKSLREHGNGSGDQIKIDNIFVRHYTKMRNDRRNDPNKGRTHLRVLCFRLGNYKT